MELQEQLFKAIEVIIDGKIASLPKESYIECIVSSSEQNKNGSYSVKYKDLILEAFPVGNIEYKKDEVVYVATINGDISKKKIILTLKERAGEQYVNLDNAMLDLVAGKNYIKPEYRNISYDLPSGSSQTIVGVVEEFVSDIDKQTNIVLSMDIESLLTPKVNASYGLSIVLAYEDNVNREYALSMNEVVGNVYHAHGYNQIIENLYKGSKVKSVVSVKLFINGFDAALVSNYIKFSNIRIGFVEKTLSVISEQVIYKSEIKSSSGLIFKNGTGSSILTSCFYRGTEEMDPIGDLYEYTWARKDSNGIAMTFAGGSYLKSGKALTIYGSDIDNTNTFETVVLRNGVIITSSAITISSVSDGAKGNNGAQGPPGPLLDWLQDWDGNKVLIKDKYIASPKIFAGNNSGTAASPVLTGVAIGRDVLGGTNSAVGIVGYKSNVVTYQLKTDGSAIFGKNAGSQFIVNSDGSITSPNISGDKITGGTINGVTITGTYISGGTVSGTYISGGTISGGAISGGTITGASISGGTISGAYIRTSNSSTYITMQDQNIEFYKDGAKRLSIGFDVTYSGNAFIKFVGKYGEGTPDNGFTIGSGGSISPIGAMSFENSAYFYSYVLFNDSVNFPGTATFSGIANFTGAMRKGGYDVVTMQNLSSYSLTSHTHSGYATESYVTGRGYQTSTNVTDLIGVNSIKNLSTSYPLYITQSSTNLAIYRTGDSTAWLSLGVNGDLYVRGVKH